MVKADRNSTFWLSNMLFSDIHRQAWREPEQHENRVNLSAETVKSREPLWKSVFQALPDLVHDVSLCDICCVTTLL